MEDKAVRLRNNVKVIGTGSPTLLFAHGFGCDQSIWHQVAPAFHDRATVVTFDYVGSGDSDLSQYDEQRYQSLSGYAQDLVEVVDSLESEHLILVAHSVSGSIATLAYPAIQQRLKHIVMLNPSPRYLHDKPHYQSGFDREDVDQLMVMMEQNFFAWAQGIAPQVMENPERRELAEQLTRQFSAGEQRIVRAFARATFYSDVRAELAQVDCPVTVVQANKDIVVPQRVAEYTVAQLPKAELAVIDARGHYPHVSAPAQVIAQIERVLNQATVPL